MLRLMTLGLPDTQMLSGLRDIDSHELRQLMTILQFLAFLKLGEENEYSLCLHSLCI